MNLFGVESKPENENEVEGAYTSKIKIPIYEPKGRKPEVFELFDSIKTGRLISEIIRSNVTENEKKFLTEAARRHTVFNYSKIADYYAHSNKEMQLLMEKSALVIIDFEKAVELGIITLSDNNIQQLLSDSNE